MQILYMSPGVKIWKEGGAFFASNDTQQLQNLKRALQVTHMQLESSPCVSEKLKLRKEKSDGNN